MKTTENIEIVTFVKKIISIKCNCCGKDVDPCGNSVQEIKLDFGYYSRFDMQSWNLDLCEECIIKIIKGFKIVPEKFMSDSSYISEFDSDHNLHQKLFEEWQQTDVWNYDDNPYEDNLDQEFESYEEYEEYNEEFSDAIEDRKPLHTNPFKLVK